MTPTPPSTNSSTGARSPEEQFRVVRKRNRVPLSCNPCRLRKKCDRNHPCSNCTKREGTDTSSCSYAAPVARKKGQNQADASPDDMRDRIDRLEGLVLLLMHGGANVDNTSAARDTSGPHSVADSGSSTKLGPEDSHMVEEDSDSEDELATSLGVLKVEPNQGKSMYLGQSHWHTILADISEVKNYFITHKKEIERSYESVKISKPDVAREGPTLLLGAVPASEIELRAELPPKSTIITLCSRYFNSMDNAVGIIHGPTFFSQLKKHWEDPSKTPIMWLGMLYSILCLAMLSYHKVGEEPLEWKDQTLELADEYRLRTVQCLIKADYTRPVEYTVETMILYTFGEYSSRWDADIGLWYIVSLTTRIAFRMGYHRDAKWFPSLTPFQTEMRRRTWALLRMVDVIFSHQVGLPSMIYENDCDTQIPNNIFDDELHPDIKELPPSRPLSEPTPVSYMIAKAMLCNELGNILQATTRVGKSIPYDEVIRFDEKLRQIAQELPPHLKMCKLEGCQDPVTLIVARFNVDILYQKILCLLHRKYISRARQNPRYTLSRKRAIEASMQALAHLVTLHSESQGIGRLRSVGWYVKSVATKEFILPAMLVSLELHYDNMTRQSGLPIHDGAFLLSQEQRDKMIGTLDTTRQIWSALSDTSVEAFKGSKVLEIMLEKIRHPSENDGSSMPFRGQSMPSYSSTGQGPGQSQPSSVFLDLSPMTNLGSLETKPPPLSNPPGFMGFDFDMPAASEMNFQMPSSPGTQGSSYPLPLFSPLNGFGTPGDLITNFDWGAFENYAQTATWGADQSFQVYGPGDQSSPEQDEDSKMFSGQQQ